jgi:hypothetical protein
MGWLNTLLDVGIIGLQMNQSRKLDQMRQGQANAAAVQAIVQMLRDMIFKFNQAAQEISAADDASPKIRAGAMLLLKHRLEELELAPEMFPELADKDYLASTSRLIRQKSRELLEVLPDRERQEAQASVKAAMRLPESDYYLKHYQLVEEYRAALPVYKRLSTSNNPIVYILAAGGVGMVACVMLPLLFALPGTAIGSEGLAFLGTLAGMALAVVAMMGVVALLSRSAQRKRFLTAKAAIGRIEQAEIDLQYYETLEKELGGNYNQILVRHQKDQALVTNFFQEEGIAELLTIDSGGDYEPLPEPQESYPEIGAKPDVALPVLPDRTTSAVRQCPNGHTLPKPAPFCPYCGAETVVVDNADQLNADSRCPNCGKSVFAASGFCPFCGTQLQPRET